MLHLVKGEDEEEGTALGSLGSRVGEEHKGRYDLVIGNPPWPSGTKLPKWNRVRETVARIAADRGIANSEPPLPNEVLDLPFVWRAMEWAKPDGQIAFALHARLLFQQGDGMPTARQALFEALDVTSVVNGVELRQTKVWPRVSAPFCILFATNRTPGVEACFRYISPRIEDSLNSAGGMRIDAVNADIVPSRQLADTPEILKILFRGSKADLGILERIRAQGHPTLAAFWRGKFGLSGRGGRGQLRGSGNGYQKLRRSSQVGRKGGGLPGVDARPLLGRLEITHTSFEEILVDHETLSPFLLGRVHRSRSPDLFAGPLVVVRKSLSAATGRIDVVVSDEGVIFNETFYGYSPGAHPEAALFVRYLALVLGSKFVVWFALVTSGEFGFEREVIEKATLDRIPLPAFDKLEVSRRREIAPLVDGLQSGEVTWDEVDEWVNDLYGLGKRDLKIILDTLKLNLPFAENTRNAQASPGSAERERFREVLRGELLPWCDRFGSTLTVDEIPPPAMSPWQAIAVRRPRREPTETVPADDLAGLLNTADAAAASEILVDNGSDGLLIARLAQRRYWSETQARLLAQRIAWSHVEQLKGHATA